MKRSNLFQGIFLFLFLLPVSNIWAQQQAVYAFKNGTAFTVKTIQVKPEDGKVILKEIPQATFGTLWFNSPGNPVKNIRAVTDEQEESTEIKNVFQLLKANVGKRVIIFAQDDKQYEGAIRQVDNELILLESNDQKWHAFSPGQVRTASLLSKPELQLKEKIKKESLHLDFEKKSTQQNLEMMYLQKGISWIPNYSIDLLDENRAKLSLRALLMNESEDLHKAQMSFVVGIPNFAYQYLQSPLTTPQNMASFVNTLNQYSNQPVSYAQGRVNSRADLTAQSLTNFSNEIVFDENLELEVEPIQPEGSQLNEFFFYNIPEVNLKKGERGFYDIFEQEVKYTSIYEVNLAPNSTALGSYGKSHSYRDINEVWYSIQMENNTQYPWTTGTAMIVEREGQGVRPVSQDKLSYVPVGGKGKMKITVASDISVKESEIEKELIPNHKKINRENYSLQKVEGKILIKNFKNKDVKLSISRNVIGNLINCSEAWKVTKLTTRQSSSNSANQVEWEITIPAHKEKEIIYEYEVLVRSGY